MFEEECKSDLFGAGYVQRIKILVSKFCGHRSLVLKWDYIKGVY